MRDAEVGCRLDRVTEAVAVIHDVPGSLVELVLLDDAALDLERRADVALQQLPVGEQPRVVGGDAVERLRPFDRMNFQHLADAGADVDLVERVEDRGGDHDARGWRERAEDVLRRPDVDGALGADARVGLREQRRREEVPRKAAEQCRRDEAGDVLDDPAADGDEEVPAADVLFDERVDVGGEPVEGLVRLGRFDSEDVRAGEHALQLGRVQLRDAPVDDQVRCRRRVLVHAGERVVVEHHVVRTGVRLDDKAVRRG